MGEALREAYQDIFLIKANPTKDDKEAIQGKVKSFHNATGLHYNIQIHLPATKDVEVYSAIFKSLKEHLFEV